MNNFNKFFFIIFSYLPTILSIICAGGAVYFDKHWGYCIAFMLLSLTLAPKLSITETGGIKNCNTDEEKKND